MLLPATWVKTEVSRNWNQYVALIDVAEENMRLREEKDRMDMYLAEVRDDLVELARLRALVGLKPPEKWRTLATRVLAGKFGPGGFQETVMIDRGYASGASPGTPLATHQGLVGQVFRASPHIATVILVTDQSFRVAVVTAEGRVPGVLAGAGARNNLEVLYMAPNAKVEEGEILVTSGLDDTFPKGLPVARVVSVQPGAETLFQQVQAEPIVPPESLEEALLLIAPDNWPESAALPALVPEGLKKTAASSPETGPVPQAGAPAATPPPAPSASAGGQTRQAAPARGTANRPAAR